MNTARRVVVMGSGPSLRLVDFERLRHERTIAFNRAHIAFADWGFEPTYYAAIDRNALPTNRNALARLLASSSIERFFLRHSARELGLPASSRVSYVRVGEHQRFSTDLDDLGMFGNVSAVSIQILAALGYRRFLLLGIDGNYHRAERLQRLESRYDLRAELDDDPDHFRPDYHGSGVRFTRPNNERFLRGWRLLAAAARARGLEILHASPDSAVDCFEHLDFETAWSRFVQPGTMGSRAQQASA